MESRDSKAKVDLDKSPLKGVKVLLVEDAADSRMLMSNLLDYFGAEVSTATNGAEAVQTAVNGRHHLILMDLEMPIMGGFEALKELQKANYSSPVVALTARSLVEEKVKTVEAGFAAHLNKPINAQELVTTILKLAKSEAYRS
jgi:CheY-like chemotaxis protein